MLELLIELADDSIPKLEDTDELDILDGAMLESSRLELLLEEDKDKLDTPDGEVLLEPPPLEPPPPHPTIIPPEMAKHKYRPIFDRII